MILDEKIRFSISVFILGVLVLLCVVPDFVSAASLKCEYDRDNPSLDHAVRGFMDPALFECAESELRDVLAGTEPSDSETLAAINFLLAGALFGQQLSTDIPESLISEYLIKGFLNMPEWSGEWYFSDMPEFMILVPPARVRANLLLECPFNSDQPSLEHAKRIMQRFALYDCAALEISTALTMLEAADSTDSNALAEAHFLMGQADFGLKLKGAAGIDDSIIVSNLTNGFVHSWEYSDNLLFTESDEFVGLVSQARLKAEGIRKEDKRKFYEKPIYIISGVGVAVASVLTAILISGDDEPDEGPVVDTIPSFPPPPGE